MDEKEDNIINNEKVTTDTDENVEHSEETHDQDSMENGCKDILEDHTEAIENDSTPENVPNQALESQSLIFEEKAVDKELDKNDKSLKEVIQSSLEHKDSKESDSEESSRSSSESAKKSKIDDNKQNVARKKLLNQIKKTINEFIDSLGDDIDLIEKLKKKKPGPYSHFYPKLSELETTINNYKILNTTNLGIPELKDLLHKIESLDDQLRNIDLDIRKVHPKYSRKLISKLSKQLDYDLSRPINGDPDDPTEIDIGKHRMDVNKILKKQRCHKKTLSIGVQSTYTHKIKLQKMHTLIWLWESENQSFLDFQLTYSYYLDREYRSTSLIPTCNRIWTKFSMLKCFYDGTAEFEFSNRLSLFKSKNVLFKWVILPPSEGDPLYNSYYNRVHKIHELARQFNKPFPLFDGSLSVNVKLQNSKFFETYTFSFEFSSTITLEWTVNLSYSELYILYNGICSYYPNISQKLPPFPGSIIYMFANDADKLERSKNMNKFFQKAFTSKVLRNSRLFEDTFGYSNKVKSSQKKYNEYKTKANNKGGDSDSSDFDSSDSDSSSDSESSSS